MRGEGGGTVSAVLYSQSTVYSGCSEVTGGYSWLSGRLSVYNVHQLQRATPLPRGDLLSCKTTTKHNNNKQHSAESNSELFRKRAEQLLVVVQERDRNVETDSRHWTVIMTLSLVSRWAQRPAGDDGRCSLLQPHQVPAELQPIPTQVTEWPEMTFGWSFQSTKVAFSLISKRV